MRTYRPIHAVTGLPFPPGAATLLMQASSSFSSPYWLTPDLLGHPGTFFPEISLKKKETTVPVSLPQFPGTGPWYNAGATTDPHNIHPGRVFRNIAGAPYALEGPLLAELRQIEKEKGYRCRVYDTKKAIEQHPSLGGLKPDALPVVSTSSLCLFNMEQCTHTYSPLVHTCAVHQTTLPAQIQGDLYAYMITRHWPTPRWISMKEVKKHSQIVRILQGEEPRHGYYNIEQLEDPGCVSSLSPSPRHRSALTGRFYPMKEQAILRSVQLERGYLNPFWTTRKHFAYFSPPLSLRAGESHRGVWLEQRSGSGAGKYYCVFNAEQMTDPETVSRHVLRLD